MKTIFKRIQVTLFIFGAVTAMLLTSCSSTGEQKGGRTDTDVQLNRNNYKIVRAGVMGSSYGFNLLGFIPIASPNYGSAKADLYASSGENLTGRAVALANQTEDKSSLYLILFSIPRVSITADIIEFKDDPGATAAK